MPQLENSCAAMKTPHDAAKIQCHNMHRKTVSLNIKCGELTVASLMENSQSDSQELTGHPSITRITDSITSSEAQGPWSPCCATGEAMSVRSPGSAAGEWSPLTTAGGRAHAAAETKHSQRGLDEVLSALCCLSPESCDLTIFPSTLHASCDQSQSSQAGQFQTDRNQAFTWYLWIGVYGKPEVQSEEITDEGTLGQVVEQPHFFLFPFFVEAGEDKEIETAEVSSYSKVSFVLRTHMDTLDVVPLSL
ncbi:hypothetical protein MJT46_012246 [Ovis ammon polii x Ovis aries]|nr:hypothetical protein MJT46_012246 [Ovis ammon polii x Ovis aries]